MDGPWRYCTSSGVARYESETNLELNECVIANIEDGEISVDALKDR